MITMENDSEPERYEFDLSIVAIGYERRCRWITETKNIKAHKGIGLEFGFLKDGSYKANREYFTKRGFGIIAGLGSDAIDNLAEIMSADHDKKQSISIFIDISSMSREMIANVALALNTIRSTLQLNVTAAYAPSEYSGPFKAAPIRLASPIKPSLAGWSALPELPVGALFGLGCEPGLALGALQFLEPNKAWIFSPRGLDSRFDRSLTKANQHIEDIFDASRFEYRIEAPTITRGRIEMLLNAVDRDFRVIAVPFGPKIFAWLTLATVVFTERQPEVGVWAFSSKEQAQPIDRAAGGPIIWHNLSVSVAKKTEYSSRSVSP